MKIVLALVAALSVSLTGCGPGPATRSRSQVELISDKWDGGPEFSTNGEKDAWGNEITFKVEKNSTHYVLTVRSNGYDGLPKTHDDITARRQSKHTDSGKAAGGFMREVMKGTAQGTVEGVTEGLGKEKK